MSDDRLFDPADYGVTFRERPSRTRGPALAGYADDSWMLLSHLRGSPLIHLTDGRSGFDSHLTVCGRAGTPITDHSGPAPLCPHCVEKTRRTAAALPRLYNEEEVNQ